MIANRLPAGLARECAKELSTGTLLYNERYVQ